MPDANYPIPGVAYLLGDRLRAILLERRLARLLRR